MSDLSLFSFSFRCETRPAAIICRIADARAAVSTRWPGGAATTTRSAAPFSAPNLAVIRSVAFCVSEPGILKSLMSLPWNAAFSPIRATTTPSQVATTRHGWRAQRPAKRASVPSWAIRRSSSARSASAPAPRCSVTWSPLEWSCQVRHARPAQLIGAWFGLATTPLLHLREALEAHERRGRQAGADPHLHLRAAARVALVQRRDQVGADREPDAEMGVRIRPHERRPSRGCGAGDGEAGERERAPWIAGRLGRGTRTAERDLRRPPQDAGRLLGASRACARQAGNRENGRDRDHLHGL